MYVFFLDKPRLTKIVTWYHARIYCLLCKEVNIETKKYIVPTIKSVPVLFQNVLEKNTGLYRPISAIPVNIGVLASTIKKFKI